MALKTKVKVSHVSNLSDARYCAGMGVDMLGIRVVPGQEHYVTPELFQDIRGWISGPRIIAEIYGLRDPAQLAAIADAYAPDAFELGLDDYESLAGHLTRPYMMRLPHVFTLPAYPLKGELQFLLADERVSCEDISRAPSPVLKKVKSLSDLGLALDEGCFAGIELAAAQEARPGVTNYDHLGEILEALEED